MRKFKLDWKYGLGVIGLIVLAYMVMDFNNRTAKLQRLSAKESSVAAKVTGLAQTNVSLSTRVAESTSDDAVREWAYTMGHMVRPGDNPVVPMSPAGSTPVPTPTPVPVQPQVSNMQMWLWLFTDARSP